MRAPSTLPLLLFLSFSGCLGTGAPACPTPVDLPPNAAAHADFQGPLEEVAAKLASRFGVTLTGPGVERDDEVVGVEWPTTRGTLTASQWRDDAEGQSIHVPTQAGPEVQWKYRERLPGGLDQDAWNETVALLHEVDGAVVESEWRGSAASPRLGAARATAALWVGPDGPSQDVFSAVIMREHYQEDAGDWMLFMDLWPPLLLPGKTVDAHRLDEVALETLHACSPVAVQAEREPSKSLIVFDDRVAVQARLRFQPVDDLPLGSCFIGLASTVLDLETGALLYTSVGKENDCL